jgi:hypothetical protein
MVIALTAEVKSTHELIYHMLLICRSTQTGYWTSSATAHRARAGQILQVKFYSAIKGPFVPAFGGFPRNKQPKGAKGFGCTVGFFKSQAFSFRQGKAPF